MKNANSLSPGLDALDEQLNNTINQLKKEHDAIKKRQEDIIDRQDALTRKHGGNNSKPSDIIHLSLRGTEMFARRDTLTCVKGSRLESLFSGRWENKLLRDEQGSVFIDIDPEIFKKILQYLYMVKISKGDDLHFPTNEMTETDQETFQAHIDFLALRNKDDNKDGVVRSSEAVNAVDAPVEDEQSLVRGMKRKLDAMEEKLVAEETFINHFKKKDSRDNEEPQSIQEADTVLVQSTIKQKELQKAQGTRDLGITNLYVNGEILTYKTSTLCLDATSKLAQDLSNEDWKTENAVPTEDGKECFLIEQPAYLFKKLVEYLHRKVITKDGCEIPLPSLNGAFDRTHFKRMVNHFFIEGGTIQAAIGDFMDSAIIENTANEAQIKKWLANVNRSLAPKLLYRASRDGWDAKDFHRLCDRKGPTIVIVKSSAGYIFGGYTSNAWISENDWKTSRDSFLFGLKCYGTTEPVCMSKNENYGHYGQGKSCVNGPVFGQDLCIVSNANESNSCRSNCGYSYFLPDGISNSNLLTGSSTYQAAEWEVFQV